MSYFDYITKKDIKEHNPNWPKNPDHPYRIKIIRGSKKFQKWHSKKVRCLDILI